MATREELEARLEKLRKHRASGMRRVEFGDQRLEYRSDAELAAAIGDLERQLAGAAGAHIHTVRVTATKGLD